MRGARGRREETRSAEAAQRHMQVTKAEDRPAWISGRIADRNRDSSRKKPKFAAYGKNVWTLFDVRADDNSNFKRRTDTAPRWQAVLPTPTNSRKKHDLVERSEPLTSKYDSATDREYEETREDWQPSLWRMDRARRSLLQGRSARTEAAADAVQAPVCSAREPAREKAPSPRTRTPRSYCGARIVRK